MKASCCVQVNRVDRAPPSLTTRRSPSTVVELGGGRYGIFITSKHLQASDPDSPTEQLEFSIVRPPNFGYLENVLTGRLSHSNRSHQWSEWFKLSLLVLTGAYIRGRFAQRDVNQRAVVFVLPANAEVTADSFQFRLIDPAGNMAQTEM